MTKRIYTTEELSEILKAELRACMNGQRTFPMPPEAESIAKKYPLGSILSADRIFQIGCYHEFRDQVQQYQLEHGISGLKTGKYTIRKREYIFPVPEDQLNLNQNDYEILKSVKTEIIDAFLSFDDGFTYLSFDHEDSKTGLIQVETTANYVRYFAEISDWAELIECTDYYATLRLGCGDYYESPCIFFTIAKACINY